MQHDPTRSDGPLSYDDYVSRYRPALMRFATVLTGQTWLAEDVVSDVLGRAFERWDRISQVDEPHAYVRRMIVNEHLSWRRKLARTAPHADLEPQARPVADSADRVAERDAMLQRLDRLSRRQRTAVVLRFYADLSDTEIAEHLGCRESTVRSLISRALGALRLDAAADRPVPMEA